MTLSAIHNLRDPPHSPWLVVCDIGGGYDFVSYSQPLAQDDVVVVVVCDIGGI